MTEISAKIIKDSISPDGVRITTIHMRYPRFIHAELMTHRVFSRNARSSRAVPIEKMLKECMEDPVVPLYWGKNQKGMQASEECNEPVALKTEVLALQQYTVGEEPLKFKTRYGEVEAGPTYYSYKKEYTREEAWLLARNSAVEHAHAFMEAGYHKQVVNRLIEPFIHIDTLVTSTYWKNFLYLRDHKDAEPHIRDLAIAVQKAMDESQPEKLNYHEWHLPYVTQEDHDQYKDYAYAGNVLVKVSAARCARISYTPFEGIGNHASEIERYNKLVGDPMHASPMEHQALAFNPSMGYSKEYCGNFYGWIQYRKTLKNEAQMEYQNEEN
jgi:thymidylate synthase ThyX